jgi:hypothetical protein
MVASTHSQTPPGVSSPSAMSSALMPVNNSPAPSQSTCTEETRRVAGYAEAMTAAAISPNGRFRKNTHRQFK